MYGKKTNDPKTPEVKGPGVSELLKTTRERVGQDLETVAQVLRIRLVYLQAIEDGRYEDLPGKTYVVGFVRAYSEHLGLDVEEVVNRFKQEVEGMESKADLVFPSPATEQSVPGGAIILISLVIIGVVYGGWYFMSSQDRDMAELVPDLPAKFAEMVKSDPEEATPEEEATETTPSSDDTTEVQEEVTPEDAGEMAARALEAVESTDSPSEEVNVETVVVETEQAVTTVTSAQTEASSEEEGLVASVANVIEKVEEQVQAVIEPDETATVEETATEEVVEEVTQEVVEAQEALEVTEPVAEPTVTEENTEEASTEEEATEPETTETSEVAELVEEEEPAASAPPAVMNSKIVLKAVDYSWIQLIESNGTVVHTQALNQGDEYETPRRAGLILRTGNAGGLEIFVDDEKVPAIGEFGEVRRRVLMDPTRLKSGRAVER